MYRVREHCAVRKRQRTAALQDLRNFAGPIGREASWSAPVLWRFLPSKRLEP